MRIQHNISAMNSYRNYMNNSGALSKNLEKLSSGYRINRAGDDAAGLAISEKMRAQITGLDAAQKNVQDGISLVKTAEGAMQEIHDMLNRMKYLAVQSANGTYEDEVDRENLQAEVDALKSEINRIADSANFNGRTLLDGSLSADGATVTSSTALDVSKIGVDLLVNAKETSAVKGKYTTDKLLAKAATANQLTAAAANGDTINIKLDYENEEGKTVTKEFTLKVGKDKAGATDAKGLWLDDGSENGVWLGDLTAAGKIKDVQLAAAIDKIADKDADLKKAFDVTAASGALTFEARTRGTAGAKLTGISLSFTDKDATGATPTPVVNNVTIMEATKAEDAFKAFDFAADANVFNMDATDGSTSATKDINEAIFEINGEKFVFIEKSKQNDVNYQAALREAGVTNWVEVATSNTIAAADIKNMVSKIATATGLRVEQGKTSVASGATKWTAATTGTKIIFRLPDDVKSNNAEGGMTLQIGDTAESFNQLQVQIEDMHVKALGLDEMNISSLKNAQKAEEVITDAINKVSSTRGNLGAIQNRLEHTSKNLSVMEENIQNAESAIRDTDVADEMTQYTKNNILLQSAQAMLAQANQMPQGVLQLLQ